MVMVTQIDHNCAWRFSRNGYVIFINRPVGVEANAKFLIETCITSVKVSNVSFCLLIFHSERIDHCPWTYFIASEACRQVSNARSRGIIADYRVFNLMQHQMGL